MLEDAEVDGLLRVALLLVIVWLIVEIALSLLDATLGLLGPLRPVLGLLIVGFAIWWLYDQL